MTPRLTRSLLPPVVLGLSAGHAALVRRHAWYYFVRRDRARVFAGRVVAKLCPTTGPARHVSATLLRLSGLGGAADHGSEVVIRSEFRLSGLWIRSSFASRVSA